MFISFQRRIVVLFIGFAIISSFFFVCGEKGSQPVARVGGRIITTRDFEDSFSRGKSQEIIAKSSLEKKLEHLNKMIDKELQIVAAYQKNLDKDEEIIKKVEQRGESAILRRLIDKDVIDPSISKAEIKKIYNKSKKQVKILEIVLKMNPNAPEKEQEVIKNKLQKINEEIKGGADFSNLVEKYSQDKNKRVAPEKGQKGLLKWNPSTAEDPIYQKAFSMKIGEVSEPIKTNRGYSIIKVVEFIKPVVKPFSSEEKRIKQQLLRVRSKELEKKYFEYLEKLKRKFDTKFQDENIQRFIQVVSEVANDTSKKSKPRLPMDRKEPFQRFSNEDKKLPLITYEGEEITIKKFIDELNRVPMTRRPNIQDKEVVFNLIDRRILSLELLKLEANIQNLKNDNEVKEQFKSFCESYILSKIKIWKLKTKSQLRMMT